MYKSSVESKKGINALQRCSVENQKGAIARLCTAIALFWLEGRYRKTLYIQQLRPSGSEQNMVEQH